MENMDKRLTVPKWVLIVAPKILQMHLNLSAQFVCPSQKNLDFNEKRLHWASVVSKLNHETVAVLPLHVLRQIVRQLSKYSGLLNSCRPTFIYKSINADEKNDRNAQIDVKMYQNCDVKIKHTCLEEIFGSTSKPTNNIFIILILGKSAEI